MQDDGPKGGCLLVSSKGLSGGRRHTRCSIGRSGHFSVTYALKNGTTKSESACVRYRLRSCHQQMRSGRSGTETENRCDGGAIPAGPEEPLEHARLDKQRWRRGFVSLEPGSQSQGLGPTALGPMPRQIYCTSIRFHYGETEPAQSITVAPSQTRERISSCRRTIDDALSAVVPIHMYGVPVHSFVC
ncbi:hypothetical protein CKAH01_05090 [Colletotrichum kahawae]|uniref:Uncharacterized protein n=1 Tax=Colletotrichum kahawae TaxID=34407 RepID=A0AAD9YFX8_COLKA|nr:hypothetical protein CKAH01_05090 [Colletotrichum kahawae]